MVATNPILSAEVAADLRREANDLQRSASDMIARAARLRALADQLDRTPPPSGVLDGRAAEAAAIIRATPGLTGDEVADRLGIVGITFRRHLAPKLKMAGVWVNPRGGGYHPPVEGTRTV